MKAAELRRCGEPPQVVDRADPLPGAGEALLEVTAAPITPLDLLCASGTSYWGTPRLPYVPGVQGVGRVRRSDRFPPGRRVWFPTPAGMRPGDGSLAELAVAPDTDLVELPPGLDDPLAAALGLSAVAAWGALRLRARLRPGEHVLVLGASGVVGQVAVQAARIMGAGRVAAAARSRAGRELAAGQGADAAVDLSDPGDVSRLAELFRQACDGGADVVIDPVCGPAATAAIRALRPGGRLVNLGSAAGEAASFDSATLRSASLAVLGYTNAALSGAETAGLLREVFAEAAAGRLTVAYDPVPLSGVPAGWARQQAGTAGRRVVAVPAAG